MISQPFRHQSHKSFLAAVGVTSARFLLKQPPFIKRGRSVGRFAVGIRYEAAVKERLELYCLGRPEVELRLGPWIEFRDKRGLRWCQPDAMLVNSEEKTCLICEVKYSHTADAWWQLKQLYSPVVAVALQGYDQRLVEIVHWFDPLVEWPEPHKLVESIREIERGDAVSIHICNPKRSARI